MNEIARCMISLIGLGLVACEGEYRPYVYRGAATAAEDAGPTTARVDSVAQDAPHMVNGVAASGTAVEFDCPTDAGACASGSVCPGCLIEGECVADATREPGNGCQICSPERDPLGWSPNDGASCDDQLFCTVDDVCLAGVCAGAPRECDDDVACNGTSVCQEETDGCSLPVSQCGDNSVCNAATDTCENTCEGCIVAGVCVLEGAAAPGDPCRVCDPARSMTTYSIAVGRVCGEPATACSGQDSCNAQGACQPNHFAAGSPCGNPNASACDQADTCDGNGSCQTRQAANGSACDDGAFCTTGDQCQAGQCVAGGQLNCGASRSCNEAANQCECQGCQIGNTCIAAGAINPQNPCQVCNGSGFNPNTGANCGSGPTECSAQDTCNAEGQCIANDRNGASCTGGVCSAGNCTPLPQPTGTVCSDPAQCQSGFCRLWFEDLDGDLFGNGQRSALLCSPSPENDETRANSTVGDIPVLSARGIQYSGRRDDCCDVVSGASSELRPFNSSFFSLPQAACQNVDPFDYDCSGTIVDSLNNRSAQTSGCPVSCDRDIWAGAIPPCGQSGLAQQCRLIGGTCTLGTTFMAQRFCH